LSLSTQLSEGKYLEISAMRAGSHLYATLVMSGLRIGYGPDAKPDKPGNPVQLFLSVVLKTDLIFFYELSPLSAQ